MYKIEHFSKSDRVYLDGFVDDGLIAKDHEHYIVHIKTPFSVQKMIQDKCESSSDSLNNSKNSEDSSDTLTQSNKNLGYAYSGIIEKYDNLKEFAFRQNINTNVVSYAPSTSISNEEDYINELQNLNTILKESHCNDKDMNSHVYNILETRLVKDIDHILGDLHMDSDS